MMPRFRRMTLLLVAALALRAPAAFAQGCAMCATGIGGANDPLARGMNISILFLMSMPFLLTASVGGWLWYSFWRARRRNPPLQVLRVEREEVS
jgi:hypothetical protein